MLSISNRPTVMLGKLLFLLSTLAVVSAQSYGVIENFKQTQNTIDTITLEWDLTGGEIAIQKYTLVTDDDFMQDIRCPVAHCTHVVDYLDSCTMYQFTLTPHFKDHFEGDTVATSGNTVEEIPSAPMNPSVVTSNRGLLVTWKPPTESPNCVAKYILCARIKGEVATDCHETKDLTLLLSDVQLCSDYVITISPATPMEQFGPSASTEARTEEGVPGAPENVVVKLSTPTMIKITYDDPLTNPHCVDEFGVMYGEVNRDANHVTRARLPGVRKSHEHTISPLDACTNYTIGVYGISPAGIIGPSTVQYAATADVEPRPPPAVLVNPTGSDSLDVVWPGDPTNKCADTIEVCWTDHIHPEEICQGIDDKDTIDGGGTFTITDLLPCSNYEVTVTIDSPTGMSSIPLSNWTFTDDITPGAVENLAVKGVEVNRVTITYSPPSEQKQCVKEYDTRVINLDEQWWSNLPAEVSNNGPTIEESHNQLEACTNYAFHVRTVSRSGLMSPWNIIETKTNEAKPSEPRNLQVKDTTEFSVTLIWFQPETNKMCATSYRLDWASGPATGSHKIDIDTSQHIPFEMEHIVSGLESGTVYTFTVTTLSETLGESKSTPLKVKTL